MSLFWKQSARDFNAKALREIADHAERLLRCAVIANAEDVRQAQAYQKLLRGIENIIETQGEKP